MIKIEYPPNDFKIRTDAGKEYIFDELRKLWVRLTPEEWVRQNFLQYLVQVKNFPAALIAIEKEILLGELRKRIDVLVYDFRHRPWMIIECKAMEIALNEKVLHQVLRYNMSVPVHFLIITNGTYVAGFERKDTGLTMIHEFPEWRPPAANP